jgi:hypothetical protein
MVDTIGRCAAGAMTRVAACVTFTLGALAGGVVTFATLALAGRAIHGRGDWIAGAIAAGAALAEARRLRIVPQIRRQVPESWRRVLPLPVAVGGYGVLLGLGFTTFVLTFGVWALAAVSFALGNLGLGAITGVAFGAGRAFPVAVLAPLAERPVGLHAVELMAEGGTLRLTRLANAAALAALAAAVLADAASAAGLVARGAADPSAAGSLVAWDAGKRSVLRFAKGELMRIDATDPALGGRYVAWIDGTTIQVVNVATLQPAFTFHVAGVSEIAVSDRWLVYRAHRSGGGDRIGAVSLTAPGVQRFVAGGVYLSRPAVSGDVVVYSAASTRATAIYASDLASKTTRRVRFSDSVQLSNPSLRGNRLLYVRASNLDQRLVLGVLTRGRDRTVLRVGAPATRDSGYDRGYSHRTRTPPRRRPAPFLLWTTALGAGHAYVTLLPRSGRIAAARILDVSI